MPRLNKLKMAKYLPVLYSRVCTASQLLGLPVPEKFNPKNCSLNNVLLSVKADDGTLITSMDLETFRLQLPDGRFLDQHSFWELSSKPTDAGYYSDCGCSECTSIRDAFESQQADTLSRQMHHFVIPINLPREERINSTSPEANSRLPKDYQIVKPVPVIVSYQPLLTEPCYDD